MKHIPILTVIAGRPSANRPYETTHRTRARWRDDLEAAARLAFYGFCILAGVYLAAVLVLSLQVPR